ncbi:ATP-binding protein [Streptomyces violens]|uniref:ATP-binding protein n=1 Tax=Streptomyces violens TaxID=66377 RepID=UPI00068F4955|nr:hypothetical protein [Streptomyces violens]
MTLTGVGGVGKTRLALRAADVVRARYLDGVWLVELSPLCSAEPLALAIAEALRLVDQTVRPMPEVLAEWIQDKELLLVLDTCEHLVDGCVDLVANLLTVAPGLTVLCTSRQPLRVRGERLLELGPLAVPGNRPAAGAEECEALTLFTQRATAAVPGLRFTGAEAAAAAEVCRRLDGLPLALELAGARLKQMSVQDLADRLHERFEVLVGDGETGGDNGTGLPRHRMLRTAIGWSHELCAPRERLLWARLSVFPGGFDRQAAEFVCSSGPIPAEEVRGLLAGLVDKSIVLREAREEEDAERPRYRLLDTVREYGKEWLDRLGEVDPIRQHRDYYLRLAEQGAREWLGPHQVQWRHRLLREHANLRTALDFCLGEPDRSALRMAGALWFFWNACGYLREGRHYLEAALALSPEASPEHIRALWGCGVIATIQGDRAATERLSAACAAAAQQRGDAATRAAALLLAGNVMALRGDLAGALTAFDEARRAAEQDSATSLTLSSLTGVAWAHLARGEFDRAAAVADEVRTRWTPHGELWIRGYADYLHGRADLGRGEVASAVAHGRAAVEAKWLLHDTAGLAEALDLLAKAAAAGGRGGRAARLLGFADQVWQSFGRPQMGNSPPLLAARAACERQAKAAIGDQAFEAAYQEGLDFPSLDEGIVYALARPPDPPPQSASSSPPVR